MKHSWNFATAGALLLTLASLPFPVLGGRIPWETSRVQGSPEPPPAARVERVHANVVFKSPVELQHDPARDLWWVAQHGGQLLVLESNPAAARTPAPPHVALDLAANQRPFNQLLGFALDPGHATNRWIFVAYVHADGKPEGSRVSRFAFSEGPRPVVDMASEVVLLTWLGGGHNGCALRFGPDGKLYISTGDGSSPEPPDALRTGQRLDDLLSSILRIDVHPADRSKPWEVPSDNPFVNRAGARPEVWAYGFRNPWRMSFAPDGSLWVSDVGWERWETVHRVTAGYNGGWAREEGPNVVDASVQAPTPVGRPVAAHPHTEAASITGGVFHQGSELASFRGQHVYGDWETGKIWMLATTPGAHPVEVADTPLKIVAFANGPGGETYLLDHQGGGMHRLVANTARPAVPFPTALSRTGLFSDVARQEPAPGVVPYEVVEPRWHDGARARRWIAVPGDAPFEPGAWKPGTVLVKTLSLPTSNAAVLDPIETQLLHYNGESWAAYTYRWNTNATDAALVPAAGDSIERTVPGEGPRRWTFQARSDCLRCHNSWPGFVLGFQVPQLAASGTLDRWRALGWLGTNVPATPSMDLVSHLDASKPVPQRARSWLHVNCAPCHRFGAGAAVAARFGLEEPLDKLALVDVPPSRGTFGIADARLVAPGAPGRSVALHRILTGGAGHMPPIGTRQPDPAGARVVADWIRGLAQPGNTPSRFQAGSVEDALETLSTTLPARPSPEAVHQGMAAKAAVVRDLWSPYAPPTQRRETLGETVPVQALLAARGDPARGRRLFASDDGPGCVRCHAVDGQGGKFGPDLARLGSQRSRADVLESIVMPSRVVAEAYRVHQLELRDGSSLVGLVERRADGSRRIRVEDGTERTVSQGDLVRDEPLAGSAMPEGLLSSLTFEEAADLLEYLASLR